MENDEVSGLPVRGLAHSKAWLKLRRAEPEPPTSGIPNGWNPEEFNWRDLGAMETGSIFIPSHPRRSFASPAVMTDTKGNVGIRIASQNPALTLGSAGAKLELVVCFGKPSPSKQPRASPFQNTDGSPKTDRKSVV